MPDQQGERLEAGDKLMIGTEPRMKSREPKVMIRFTGRSPIAVKLYELERMRCNLCGEVFTAKSPPGVGEEKYDSESASMLGLLRYGSGMPFNRLEKLQENFGIPLPSQTQWEIVARASEDLEPIYCEQTHTQRRHDDENPRRRTSPQDGTEKFACGSGRLHDWDCRQMQRLLDRDIHDRSEA